MVYFNGLRTHPNCKLHLLMLNYFCLLFKLSLICLDHTTGDLEQECWNRAVDSSEQPELFEFDHVYPHSSITGPVAILYGAVGTECFKEFHVILVEASKKVKS